MANVNNPVIGTVPCYNRGCTEIASVHQIQKGSREGELYTRCPECKCNQSTGRPFQKYLHEMAEFRDGYEHLSTKEVEPETDADQEPEKAATDENAKTEKTPAGKTKKGGIVAVIGTLAAFGLLFVGAGK